MMAYAQTACPSGAGQPIKRQHSATPLTDEPTSKERATEEKMAARLRSFHITPRFEQADHWFFMRPQESFDQIERRYVRLVCACVMLLTANI
jgi:hypothetical protein